MERTTKNKPAPDWRITNPKYQETSVRISRDGRTFSMDGGRVADMIRMGQRKEGRK